MNHVRQELILNFIERHNVVTIKQLQQLCPDVSLMTIHRDLQALEDRGAVVKVRGGARSIGIWIFSSSAVFS